MLAKAVAAKQLRAAYITSSKAEIECLNHDVYDVSISRKRVTAVVVQVRTFWRHKRKGYTRVGRQYFLIAKRGRKLEVTELDAATCVKRAKNTTKLGQLVAHYTGGQTVRCKSPVADVYRAFKVLAQADDGGLYSVYDHSAYRRGVWRSQAAKPDHGGGFYFYWNATEALEGVRNSTTFNAAWAEGKTLVLCEVEVSGRTVDYAGGKVASTRLRVVGVPQRLEADPTGGD